MHKKTNENWVHLFLFISYLHLNVFIVSTQCHQHSVRALTLPDPSSVDVDLHRIGGVQRLVIVEDEDVTPQGMDTGRVHRRVLGKGMEEEMVKRQRDKNKDG